MKIKCVLNVQSKSENPQQSAVAVRTFHVNERTKSSGFTVLRQDPHDLSFGSFLTFFAPWYRRSREASSVKIAYKNSKEKLVKCAAEVARLYRVSTQSCTQNQPSPKFQSRSRDWIWLSYPLDYLHETWHTSSSCCWLQKRCLRFLIFAQGLSYGHSSKKKNDVKSSLNFERP